MPVDTTSLSGIACAQDSDCTEHPYGHCEITYYGFEGVRDPRSYCDYGCTTDEDCGSSNICKCGAVIGTCTRSTCTTDADCQPGLLCANAYGDCGEVFACQLPGDSCSQNSDCLSGDVCATDLGNPAMPRSCRMGCIE